MGIITKNIEIKINGHNIDYYKNLGYICNKKDKIIIPIEHLKSSNTVKIEVQCDYCGIIFFQRYNEYIRGQSGVKKICCANSTCQNKKREENMILKYGVKNAMQVDFIHKKVESTNLKKYGVRNVAQNKEIQDKMKNTSLERYGVDNPSKNPEIQQRAKDRSMEKYGTEYPAQSKIVRDKSQKTLKEKYGVNTPFKIPEVQEKLKALGKDGSVIQKYICSIYNGELSVNMGVYVTDILLKDDNIIVEVDGGGHTLKIKFGMETSDVFYEKEFGREKHLILRGYKILRIITQKSKLPNETLLKEILENAKKTFNNGYNVYRYNLDTKNSLYY